MVDMYNRRFDVGDETFSVIQDSFTVVSITQSMKYTLGNVSSCKFLGVNSI